MNPAADPRTAQLFPGDLAGPVPPKPTAKELAAARAARYAQKHGQAVTIFLPPDVVAALNVWCDARGKKKSAVIEKLIRTQLLRPR